ncbi:MAG: hypothetical protein JWN90_437 [Parcubacteria group bacterium]|nr:hypothetical protein [Parcubacteria group bacterium]
MNIFKPTRFTWAQLSLFKWAVFLIGIVVGATWPGIFAPYSLLLLVIGLVISLYLVIVWARNK